MSIAVTCPSGHALKVADSMAGRAGRCPFCREIVDVPALSPPVEAGKSKLASRSRLSKGTANAGAPPVSTSASKSVSSSAPPAAVSPDPAAADTVLMPLSEMPPPDGGPFAAQQTAAEPDSPVMADAGAGNGDPDLMAQTLPLPTAELLPGRTAGAAGGAYDLGVDTAGHKARIVGSWKILGDAEPPCVPEPGAHRAPSAAATAPHAVRTGPPPLPPPLPNAVPEEPAHARSESNASDRAAAPKKTAWVGKPIAKGSISPTRATVYRIAVGLVFVTFVSVWPALRYWDLRVAPGWARGVLLVALLQLAYAAWLVSIPDWASLWGMMVVLAIVATIYGTAATMTLATPMEHEPPLGLEESLRRTAPYWCGGIMLLTISAAYVCGHAAQRIRRVGRTT